MSLWDEGRLALAFLTRLPVGPKTEVSSHDLGRSMAWFPFAGLVLGAGLAAVDGALPMVWSSPLRDGLLVTLLVAATGALHLDGVADVCDGLAGGDDRQRALRIMKDSQLGTFGVVGLVVILLLKVLALAALPQSLRGAALLFFPAAGRWLCVVTARLCPYARPEGGTGQAFTEAVGWREVGGATLLVLLPAVVGFGLWGLLTVALLAGAAWGAGRLATRRFGGVTGDVLGAVIEGGEVLCLLLLLGAG